MADLMESNISGRLDKTTNLISLTRDKKVFCTLTEDETVDVVGILQGLYKLLPERKYKEI